MPKVYSKWQAVPAGSVYIGRPSKWGNPFQMAGEDTRNAVCDAFEERCNNDPQFIAMVKRELRGKNLVCFCAPKRCHGDTLLRIANEEDEEHVSN